jgi:hypothetical protein
MSDNKYSIADESIENINELERSKPVRISDSKYFNFLEDNSYNKKNKKVEEAIKNLDILLAKKKEEDNN